MYYLFGISFLLSALALVGSNSSHQLSSTRTLEGSLVQNACSKDNGRAKCCVFQYKGWLRTWQGQLCGTTIIGKMIMYKLRVRRC